MQIIAPGRPSRPRSRPPFISPGLLHAPVRPGERPMNRKTRRKLAVGLIDEISQECEAWLRDPSSAYPFLDMVFSETPCFANERDANVITQSLERCARLGELLETVGRPGSVARLEKAVDAIKKELARAQRGVDCGHRRDQCLDAVKHTVRRFVARLKIVKSELARRAGKVGGAQTGSGRAGR